MTMYAGAHVVLDQLILPIRDLEESILIPLGSIARLQSPILCDRLFRRRNIVEITLPDSGSSDPQFSDGFITLVNRVHRRLSDEPRDSGGADPVRRGYQPLPNASSPTRQAMIRSCRTL